MPESRISKARALSLQLPLVPNAQQILSLDERSRKTVVQVLALLLLEAAGVDVRRERSDDRA